MSANMMPSDNDLRQFLLGALSEDRVQSVRDWMDADPAHASRLARVVVRDEFAETFGGPGEVAREEAIERIVRGVAFALSETPLNCDETVSLADPSPISMPESNPLAAENGWPSRLGEYRIVREIGRGGMGVVLEVSDDVLNRPAAGAVPASAGRGRRVGGEDRQGRQNA